MENFCEPLKTPFVLGGLSLGGLLALSYAAKNPNKVHALVLIGVPYPMPKRLLKVQTIIFFCMPNKIFQKLGITKKEILSLIRSMTCLDLDSMVESIHCPTTILYGEKDTFNKKAAFTLHQRIPDSKIREIKKAGHEVNIDNPEALAIILKQMEN